MKELRKRKPYFLLVQKEEYLRTSEIFEGQVFMTEEELYPFLVNERDVLNEVKKKGK